MSALFQKAAILSAKKAIFICILALYGKHITDCSLDKLKAKYTNVLQGTQLIPFLPPLCATTLNNKHKTNKIFQNNGCINTAKSKVRGVTLSLHYAISKTSILMT